MPRCKQFLSLFLLTLFIGYQTPGEVWHLFATHTDTEHQHHAVGNEVRFEKQHHHCELLKYHAETQMYFTPTSSWVVKKINSWFHENETVAINTKGFNPYVHEVKSLRAPPALV
jgi:hypothetical protein